MTSSAATLQATSPAVGARIEKIELATGAEIYRLMEKLYPICRSLTGAGQRETLAILRPVIERPIHEVRSGTPVFDWTVPREWNIRGGYIKDASGRKVVDFADSNLHVMGYNLPG